MKTKTDVLREILSLAKSELNENGSISYKMPDGKHHIYIYFDDSITYADASKTIEDGYYVIEPNRVVEGAMEPLGDTMTAEYNDFAELLIGCEWCMEQFELATENEKKMDTDIVASVSDKSVYTHWKAYVLTEEEVGSLVDNALKTIRGEGVVAGSGYYGLKAFEVGGEQFNLCCEICKLRDDESSELSYSVYYAVEFDEGDNLFSDWVNVDCLDKSVLKKKVFEIASTDFTDDVAKYLKNIDCVRESNVNKYIFTVEYLYENKECSISFSIDSTEKPKFAWIIEQIKKEFSSLYSNDDSLKFFDSIYCIDFLVENNGEYVDHDELCGEELLNLLKKVMPSFLNKRVSVDEQIKAATGIASGSSGRVAGKDEFERE